jgi:SAM-dependent methyltransferase
MRHDSTVGRGHLSAGEYWGRSEAVASMPAAAGALPVEEALLAEAVGRAGGTAAVRQVVVVGVGAGRELAAVRNAAPEAEILAFDISPAMVAAARREATDAGLDRVEVRVGDVAGEAPRAERAADLVVATNAVLCYPEGRAARERAFAGLASLARPGAGLMLVVQQRNGRLDWAVWFAARGVLARLGLVAGGPGDRRNVRDGAALLVHHFGAAELRGHLERAGFVDPTVRSLRSWARGEGRAVPRRSPNPLVVTAVRR